jgi:hypothetical protein
MLVFDFGGNNPFGAVNRNIDSEGGVPGTGREPPTPPPDDAPPPTTKHLQISPGMTLTMSPQQLPKAPPLPQAGRPVPVDITTRPQAAQQIVAAPTMVSPPTDRPSITLAPPPPRMVTTSTTPSAAAVEAMAPAPGPTAVAEPKSRIGWWIGGGLLVLAIGGGVAVAVTRKPKLTRPRR